MIRLQSTAVSNQPFPPSPLDVAAAATMAAGAAVGAMGVPSAVGSAVATAGSAVSQVGGALGQRVPSEVYDHDGTFLFPKWAFAADEAPRILRQKRRRASIARGEGGCSDLCPGHRFTLDDHPAQQLDGDYVVTEVEHRGETQAQEGKPFTVYWNTFECAPAVMTYVPPRPKRKSVQVSLTATVVGPAGDDIHTDAQARIRVQFHWDREGKYDEKSSCWIRAMQPWAGAAWGHQFIPRVGMEVVVAFDGGDPDKPMVLGSLYNGTHPAPFTLPGDKTRSGIRTQTSPGGGGFNELSFEDAKGKEQVYVHAQRNLDEKIEKNHTLLVRNDEFMRIQGNRMDTVEQNLTARVGHNVDEQIGGDHRSRIGQNRHHTVDGADYEVVKGSQMTSIEERLGVQVREGYSLMIGDAKAPRSADVFAWSDYALGAGGKIRLTAKGGISLRCGDSSIEVTKDGITIKGPVISMSGAKAVKMAGKGPALTLGDEAELTAKVITAGDQKTWKSEGDPEVCGEILFDVDDQSAALMIWYFAEYPQDNRHYWTHYVADEEEDCYKFSGGAGFNLEMNYEFDPKLSMAAWVAKIAPPPPSSSGTMNAQAKCGETGHVSPPAASKDVMLVPKQSTIPPTSFQVNLLTHNCNWAKQWVAKDPDHRTTVKVTVVKVLGVPVATYGKFVVTQEMPSDTRTQIWMSPTHEPQDMANSRPKPAGDDDHPSFHEVPTDAQVTDTP